MTGIIVIRDERIKANYKLAFFISYCFFTSSKEFSTFERCLTRILTANRFAFCSFPSHLFYLEKI